MILSSWNRTTSVVHLSCYLSWNPSSQVTLTCTINPCKSYAKTKKLHENIKIDKIKDLKMIFQSFLLDYRWNFIKK